ncbi:ArsR/SmtB family transcription factor [Nocardioides kribbensis]|uniref:ArsR/SmtB family transcription factor n=1 Tax=Nocardioides kribbensis TaxID=305517 RepID=UPI0032DAE6FC
MTKPTADVTSSALPPDPGRETAALTAAACLFHGFSDRSRLALVQHLASGEHRVVDLVRRLGLAQSTVSQHLACLVDCGIARSRPQGRASVYSLAHPEATMALLASAEQVLALTGDAVTLCGTYGVDAAPAGPAHERPVVEDDVDGHAR